MVDEREILDSLDLIFKDKIHKVIISKKRIQDVAYKKIVFEDKSDYYLVESFTDKQAFHRKVCYAEIRSACRELLTTDFMQMNAFGERSEYQIAISKKGKVLYKKTAAAAPVMIQSGHNRKKNYLIPEGSPVPPLYDMGIFTREGKIVASMHDKYRQINRFLEIIDEAADRLKRKSLHIIDFGCGKSYLTFAVYYYFKEIKKIDIRITGLDLKADVIEKCNVSAKKYGYTGLRFLTGDIRDYEKDEDIDMVITLHACDTATDYALYHAVMWGAGAIISVPCCQHEVNGQMKGDTLGLFCRYGIIKERTAALVTDAIRGNLLEAVGYKTQIMEFVDLSHTPKNLLIRATRSNIKQEHKDRMLSEVREMCDTFSLNPTLYRLLRESGKIADN